MTKIKVIKKPVMVVPEDTYTIKGLTKDNVNTLLNALACKSDEQASYLAAFSSNDGYTDANEYHVLYYKLRVAYRGYK